jgi:hypothetical protein
MGHARADQRQARSEEPHQPDATRDCWFFNLYRTSAGTQVPGARCPRDVVDHFQRDALFNREDANFASPWAGRCADQFHGIPPTCRCSPAGRLSIMMLSHRRRPAQTRLAGHRAASTPDHLPSYTVKASGCAGTRPIVQGGDKTSHRNAGILLSVAE